MSNGTQAQALSQAVLPRLLARLSAPWESCSYADGAAGDLLAVTVLSEGCPDFNLDAGLVEDGVLRLLATLSSQPHGLYQGAEGMLYAALELDRHFGFGMAEDAAQEFDAYLLDCLLSDRELPDHFDLVTGISGLTVYAAYRMRHGDKCLLVNACVERLRGMSIQNGQGTHWFTPPAWSRGFALGETSPLGHIDMGLAHGQPGVLASLAYALARCNGRNDTARNLLQESLLFLHCHEQHEGTSHFSIRAGEFSPTGCAWCYGDLGTVGALRLAAIALEAPAIDAWCERILQTLSRRGASETCFADPWLCHGSIGAAWLLRQVGPDQTELAARFQSEHLHHEPDGIFQRLERDPALSIGLLEGVTGAALALAHPQINTLHWSLPFLAGRDALPGVRIASA